MVQCPAYICKIPIKMPEKCREIKNNNNSKFIGESYIVE
jgi:hypothetical protein